MLRLRLTNPTRVWTAAIRHGRTGEVEWPPAPFRILAALVAGAHTLPRDDDTAAARSAIARIAACSPPLMWLPGMVVHTVPESYVAGSAIDWSKKPEKVLDLSLAVPGADDQRTKHLQHTVRGEWDHPCAFLDIDIDLDDAELEPLAAAAAAVPYVGRPTHPVDLGLTVVDPDGNVLRDFAPMDEHDEVTLGPGRGHQRWFPTESRVGVRTRCWTPDILTVLDEDHDARMSRGLAGLPDTVKGRPVSYIRGRRWHDSRWVPLSLRRKRRDVSALMDTIAETSPGAAADAIPVMAGGSVVAMLMDGEDAAVAAVTHHPDVFRGSGETHPSVRRVQAPGRAWSTDTPVVAHPNERVAHAELTAELGSLIGEGVRITSMRKLGPVTDVDELGGYERWTLSFTTPAAVSGPLRIGAGTRYGAGVCAAVREREAVR